MGVENYLITSSVVAVLAQRLVRLICTNCKESSGSIMNPFGDRVDSFKGRGCDTCNGSGYKGRAGIFELMELNDELRQMIMSNGDSGKLTEVARRQGMRNLREDGWMKVSQGITTASEVTRVTQEF
jgi:type II secretory ATPase GspE/PulE/Tfp pilus assembly ATPase PilB-like protein